MGILQKKLIIVIVLACGILACSFHSYWQKNAAPLNEIIVTPPPAYSGSGGEAADSGADDDIVVYVSGGVNKPGVYKLPTGSRVVDAVTMAGGFAADADAARINLALRLKDEMQINVPCTTIAAGTAMGASAAATASAGSSDNGKININTASNAELDKLPGIGPALAERI
ncbi:MAG: SLBB domain-containing protein, partial [Sporomusa sp.]